MDFYLLHLLRTLESFSWIFFSFRLFKSRPLNATKLFIPFFRDSIYNFKHIYLRINEKEKK